MPLSPGTRIGVYEVIGPIGAGGMGEVVRARDTKLDREVAIKILPAAFARDAERLARFEREAKALAALNHPNIAQIYGVVESDDGPALVMELVKGQPVKGPLPVGTVLGYARQLASALEAAHEKGIVHRDLKPDNILLTADGVIKVLDFGIATFAPPAASADPENTPTLTIGATVAGVIIGTAGYMSPEQASGKSVDRRSDIWSFGVVLYELLTGRRLFEGETISHTLAAVLTKDIDFAPIPAKARKLLKRCLEKDPKKRLRDIGDAPFDEEESTAFARTGLPWWVAVVAGAACLFIGWFVKPAPMALDLPMKAFSFPPPAAAMYLTGGEGASISPDGRRIAWSGQYKIWMRELSRESIMQIDGTDGATSVFWAPDSEQVGFCAGRELKRVRIGAGKPMTVASLSGYCSAGAWSADGTRIYIAENGIGISEIPTAGGAAKLLVKTDKDDRVFRMSQLPSQSGVRKLIAGLGNQGRQNVVMVNLDSGQIQPLRAGAYPVFAPPGFVIYQADARLFDLWALAYSPDSESISGEPIHIRDDAAAPSASNDGSLVWVDQGLDGELRLAVRNRRGELVADGGPTHCNARGLVIDPTGKAVAYHCDDAGNTDVWIHQLDTKVRTRLTSHQGMDNTPVWSPNGKEIVHHADDSKGGIHLLPADGSKQAVRIGPADPNAVAQDWSSDGKTLLFAWTQTKTGRDLFRLERQADGAFGSPIPFSQTEFFEMQAKFSPDGKWVAYQSDESGRREIYVREFPGGGNKRRISNNGGYYPFWRGDGKEIFYSQGDTLMAASFPNLGAPVALFQLPEISSGIGASKYAAFRDGQRFVVSEPIAGDAGSRRAIHVLQNWKALLKQSAR